METVGSAASVAEARWSCMNNFSTLSMGVKNPDSGDWTSMSLVSTPTDLVGFLVVTMLTECRPNSSRVGKVE